MSVNRKVREIIVRNVFLAAIASLLFANQATAELIWEDLTMSISGSSVGASLSRNGNCLDILVTGDVSGVANNCGRQEEGLWTVRACGKIVEVSGARGEVISSIVQNCSSNTQAISLPVGTLACFDKAEVEYIAESRSAVGITYMGLEFSGRGSDDVCGILNQRVHNLSVLQSVDNIAAPYWELRSEAGEVFYAFKEQNFE